MALQITVLLENKKIHGPLIAKPGLSLLLEDGSERILFDTGPDASYIRNASTLGIDLAGISKIVISHGHYDHIGGVGFFPFDVEVILHPDALHEKYIGILCNSHALKIKSIGSSNSAEIEKNHTVTFAENSLPIGSNFLFLGEVDSKNRKPYGITKKYSYEKDHVLDDSALVWTGKNGLVIIVGCAHSGICEIIEYAKKVTGISKVAAVVGGFHLRCASPAKLYGVLRYFRKEVIPLVYGCHCTGAWGRFWIPNARTLNTGQVVVIE